jgi:pyruvate/2-oxoglutarate dehydrogenase complex dihydrolipoamide acyltransferase (E2) component
VEAKRDVLATFDAERADAEAAKAAQPQGKAPPPQKTATPAAPPASGVPIDWNDGSAENLQRLKAADPDRFSALIRGHAAGSPSGGFSLARLTGRGGRKQ